MFQRFIVYNTYTRRSLTCIKMKPKSKPTGEKSAKKSKRNVVFDLTSHVYVQKERQRKDNGQDNQSKNDSSESQSHSEQPSSDEQIQITGVETTFQAIHQLDPHTTISEYQIKQLLYEQQHLKWSSKKQGKQYYDIKVLSKNVKKLEKIFQKKKHIQNITRQSQNMEIQCMWKAIRELKLATIERECMVKKLRQKCEDYETQKNQRIQHFRGQFHKKIQELKIKNQQLQSTLQLCRQLKKENEEKEFVINSKEKIISQIENQNKRRWLENQDIQLQRQQNQKILNRLNVLIRQKDAQSGQKTEQISQKDAKIEELSKQNQLLHQKIQSFQLKSHIHKQKMEKQKQIVQRLEKRAQQLLKMSEAQSKISSKHRKLTTNYSDYLPNKESSKNH